MIQKHARGWLSAATLVEDAPALPDALEPQQLADQDSQFLEVGGLCVHLKRRGHGSPALVLLHGFGAGVFSWREVLAPLSRRHAVVAFGRPGFGLTERPLPGEWRGPNPYSPDAQAQLTVELLDRLGIREAVLVGHSAGGTIAALVALRYPQRVRGLVLESTPIYGDAGPPRWLRQLLRRIRLRRVGPWLLRTFKAWGVAALQRAWHDPSRLTPEIIAGYTRPLRVKNWDRALWEFTLASRPLALETRLREIRVPTLVITGDDDQLVDPAESVRLAADLPHARLVIVPECGHIPHEERPAAFLAAVADFMQRLAVPQERSAA